MPRLLVDLWLPILLGLAVTGTALIAIVWASRSPNAMDDPLVAVGVAFAIIVLVAVLAPVYSLFVLLVLPLVAIGLAATMIVRRRRMG